MPSTAIPFNRISSAALLAQSAELLTQALSDRRSLVVVAPLQAPPAWLPWSSVRREPIASNLQGRKCSLSRAGSLAVTVSLRSLCACRSVEAKVNACAVVCSASSHEDEKIMEEHHNAPAVPVSSYVVSVQPASATAAAADRPQSGRHDRASQGQHANHGYTHDPAMDSALHAWGVADTDSVADPASMHERSRYCAYANELGLCAPSLMGA